MGQIKIFHLKLKTIEMSLKKYSESLLPYQILFSYAKTKIILKKKMRQNNIRNKSRKLMKRS